MHLSIANSKQFHMYLLLSFFKRRRTVDLVQLPWYQLALALALALAIAIGAFEWIFKKLGGRSSINDVSNYRSKIGFPVPNAQARCAQSMQLQMPRFSARSTDEDDDDRREAPPPTVCLATKRARRPGRRGPLSHFKIVL